MTAVILKIIIDLLGQNQTKKQNIQNNLYYAAGVTTAIGIATLAIIRTKGHPEATSKPIVKTEPKTIEN